MKERDILGVKTYSDPFYIFSGRSGPPTFHDLRCYVSDCTYNLVVTLMYSRLADVHPMQCTVEKTPIPGICCLCIRLAPAGRLTRVMAPDWPSTVMESSHLAVSAGGKPPQTTMTAQCYVIKQQHRSQRRLISPLGGSSVCYSCRVYSCDSAAARLTSLLTVT